jgi:hypothetical protein
MFSSKTYQQYLLPYECWLAQRLQPYGIHHCGDNLENVVAAYASVPDLAFVDVGWGSDVSTCRMALPDAFFSLRLNPARLRLQTSSEVAADVQALLAQAGPVEKLALCCVSMDAGTPDASVRAMFEAAADFRRRTGQA